MKLVFATLIWCADRWSRITMSQVERHQIQLLRAELGIDPQPASDTARRSRRRPRHGFCREAGVIHHPPGARLRLGGRGPAGLGQATLRWRRDERTAADVFDRVANEAIAACDGTRGLDLTEVLFDGSQHRAAAGGEGTGKNPTDRTGVPIGCAFDGANRHDIVMVAPNREGVLHRGPHHGTGTVNLDRGYDTHNVGATLVDHHIGEAMIAKCREPGEPMSPVRPLRIGLWRAVERMSSWLSNDGQLRRNSDRRRIH